MLYTSKAVGEWLGITDRQVRNLRDQGVLSEVRPGVFDMKVCVRQYLNFKIYLEFQLGSRRSRSKFLTFLSLHSKPEPRPSQKGWSGSGCCVAIFYCQIQHRTLTTA